MQNKFPQSRCWDCGTESDFNVIRRIHIAAVFADTKMQMGSGRCTCGTTVANYLALLDLLALFDDIVGHVHVNGLVAVTMVNDHIVTAAAVVGSRGHLTGTGSPDLGALRSSQVHTVVELLLAGDRMDAIAVGAGELGVLDRYLPGDLGRFCLLGLSSH